MAVSVAQFDRFLRVGYFKCISDRYGDNLAAPQNVTVVETAAEARRSPVPVILDGPSLGEVKGLPVIARYVEAGDGEELARRAARIAFSGVPVIGVCDGFLPEDPIACVDWLGLEVYARTPAEAVATIKARVRETMRRLPTAQPLVLVGQAYDMRATVDGPGWYHGDLEALSRVTIELARDARVWAVLWFSDGRPGGTRDHPELRPWHEALLRAIPTENGGVMAVNVTDAEVIAIRQLIRTNYREAGREPDDLADRWSMTYGWLRAGELRPVEDATARINRAMRQGLGLDPQ